MKKCNALLVLSTFAAVLMFVSCEKPVIDEEQETPVNSSKAGNDDSSSNTDTGGGNEKTKVVFRVSDFVVKPFDSAPTRAATDLTTYCTRLNFVVYQNGEKVKGLSQMKGDSGFGEVSMELMPGVYKLLILAHSSTGGNPVVSDPEKIQFTNDLGYSDTFSFYGDMEVEGKDSVYSYELSRNVSLLRFTVNDEFPADVKYMLFHYTGGSGVLNAVTGYGGNVNSEQKKRVNVSELSAPLTFNLYTFLQQDEATLRVNVKALAADQTTVIVERTFDNVPMKHQMVTEYNGYFFESENGFRITGNTDWGDPYQHVEY